MSVQAVQLRPATGRRAVIAAGAAEAVCVAGLAWLAALLVWTLLAPESVVPVRGAMLQTTGSADAAQPVIDRAVLWRERPFAPAGAPAPAAEEAPETTLNLALFGVVTGVGAAPGSAIIRTPDNRQHAFREGETIIDGVTLERVLANRVVIRRNGAAETLYLAGAAPTGDAQQSASGAPAATAPAAAELTADALYDALQFDVAIRNGRIFGMRLVRAVNPAVVAQAGLAEGDILIELGGRSIADTPDFADLFEGLRGAESVSIVVERDGVQVPLTVSFGSAQ